MKRALGIVLSAGLLSACGGGGGGGGASTPATPVPTTPPIQSRSVQRAVANQALAVPSAADSALTFGSVVTASTARHVQDLSRRLSANWRAGAAHATTPAGARRASSVTYSACSNGAESAIVNVSATEAQLYERVFFDSACTKLYEDLFLDAVATSQTAVQAAGTLTTYAASGVESDYATFTLSVAQTSTSSGTISLRMTDAPSATAAQTAVDGVSCSVTSSSTSASVGCGFGGVAHEATVSQDAGDTLLFNAIASSSGSVTIAGNGSSYGGALNALSLNQGVFPTWTISGGSLLDSASFQGTFTYAASGALATLSMSLTDAADDATVTMTASGTPPTITGAIKQTDTGATVATFTVDATGNGTITYGNGTTAAIVNWNVMG